MKDARHLIGLIVLCLMSINALGQATKDVYELTLEELMDVEITSASKKEENKFSAPSIVTTITRDEIIRFGGQDLYEILERATSFYGLYSYIFPKNAIGLRGNLPTHINRNILFIVNGRPFRESVKGGQNIGLLTTMPASFIKRIEIIRGPGSVLYGSNAFVGVINIITREKVHDDRLLAGLNYGTFNTYSADVSGAQHTKEWCFDYGLSVMQSDGWNFSDSTRLSRPSFNSDVTRGQFTSFNFSQKRLAAKFNSSYKNFHFHSYYGFNALGHASGFNVREGTYETNRVFLDVGFKEKLIPDIYTLEASITYNWIDDGFHSNGHQNILGHDLVVEVNNFLTVSEEFNFLFGGNSYLLTGKQIQDFTYSLKPYNKLWLNAYVQGDYLITNGLKTVVGGQLHKIPNIPVTFVPRVALLGSLGSGWGFKGLYGHALRAPYPGETDLTLRTVYGSPDLVPETIKTFEVQVFLNHDKGNISLAYFNSKIERIIARTANPNPLQSDLIYDNLGTSNAMGLEMEWKYSLSKSGYVLGSYSFQHTQTVLNETQLRSRLPRHMFKVGITQSWRNWNIAVHNSFYSRRPDTIDAMAIHNDLKAYSWLTAKLIYQLLRQETGDQRVELFFEGRNLLNITVYDPEILIGDYNGVNIKPGVNVNGGVTIKLY